MLAAAYYWTNVSRVMLFWAAFILTRPLGAPSAIFSTSRSTHGGLALSRPIASAVIAAFIVGCILLCRNGQGGTRENHGVVTVTQ